VALWYFNSAVTFLEVDRMANALAFAWQHSIQPGARVAICNQNTPATVVGLLAAWRLGAAVMPLNPMLTRRELVHVLRDGEPAAAIVGAEQARVFHEALTDCGAAVKVAVAFPGDYLPDEQAPQSLRNIPGEFPHQDGWTRMVELTASDRRLAPRSICGHEVAFLTYTSGTTGLPKAALNSHANVAFSADVYRLWLDLGPEDVLFAAAPFSHITGLVAHIVAAFAAQAPLVMCHRFEPATVLNLLHERGCTTTVAAITAYIALLEHPKFDPSRLTRFRKLFSGGAPVAPAVVDRWEKATGVYIHNAYGLTETTSPSHLVPLGRRAPLDPLTGCLSVGVPVLDTLCRIIDVQTRAPVEFGEVGELVTRGPQVVEGYWRKPDESGAAFEDGWLRTGDLAREDEEGWFYIVDRAKDMIVASGFKIWPREIEDVLLEHPAISEAAVIGVPDSYRGEAPQAFISLRAGGRVDLDELNDFCRERLASYKVPRLFTIVESLPKTASGKVLRRVLRERGE
jgi:long-chain acyl-CoA synthetase